MAVHVIDEANRCLQCKKPMCQQGCPIHTPVSYTHLSGGFYAPGKGIDGLRADLEGYMEKGYQDAKIKIGRNLDRPGSPLCYMANQECSVTVEEDIRRMETAREVLGTGRLIVDTNACLLYTSSDGPAGVALEQFVADVAEQSGGTINISLFADGTLGSASDNYSSVASGDLDMAMTGLEGLDLYAPEYTFLDSPFLIKDEAHLKALLDSGIGDKLKERYEENGFVTLGWHQRDVRELASNKEVKSPSDVAGLKLRLPGMTVYVDTWSAVSYTPLGRCHWVSGNQYHPSGRPDAGRAGYRT